jgi:hypothetical protein
MFCGTFQLVFFIVIINIILMGYIYLAFRYNYIIAEKLIGSKCKRDL